jgi:D-alanine-D-alanine ligase
MKRLLRDANIPIGKFITLKSNEEIPDIKIIEKKVGLPCFIKPANMGSSVGISKVHNESEYIQAIKKAFQYDTKILIEEFIDGREIECSVLDNDNPISSVPSEIISQHEFYSYEAKYIDEKGAILEIPAKISPKTTKEIKKLAIKTFQTLSCEGLGRIDFFLKKNNEIIVNEINTMPGFTKISMYPKLWEASGISYTKLIDKLIQLANERFNQEQKLQTNYID